MRIVKEGWRQLLNWIQHTTDEKDRTALLELLLTPEEKNALAMRCLIIRALLMKEQSQRDIAAQLGVSIAKITRGSNELKRLKPRLLKYLLTHLNQH